MSSTQQPTTQQMSQTDPNVNYLLSIQSVRERCNIIFQKALINQLNNFTVDLSKINSTVDFILQLIHRDYGTDYQSIPPHGRWQHFDAGGINRIDPLIAEWSNNGINDLEIGRRLVDLFVVSVLLDAGAGDTWKYTESSSGLQIGRSEGLAIASLYMFKDGVFGSDKLPQVDSMKLMKFTKNQLENGMQTSQNNILAGLEGRADLLIRLGHSLKQNNQLFGDNGRPGNLIDYLISKSNSDHQVDLSILWNALMTGLSSVWPPGRTCVNNISLGDAWPVSDLDLTDIPGSNIVPFHKLTQWLCYSIIVPIEKYTPLKILNQQLQTGLPEYRNGGLLVDFGVITLKPSKVSNLKDGIPTFQVYDDVVVEWRAITVGFLDYLLMEINKKIKGCQLTLPQLLEAGTWKAGREIAAEKRPSTKGPPINIISDGTVF